MFKKILMATVIVVLITGIGGALAWSIPTADWQSVWLICSMILGASSAVAFALAIIMIVLPIYAGMGFFVNKPEELNKSGFHLFTSISPGQVKIVERGEKPIRMIMNTAGKRFARIGSTNDPDYWELIAGESEDPTADIWSPLRWWSQIIYRKTGLVFTGMYPFQKVREYELERTTIVRNEDNRQSASNLLLNVKKDISDHFRVRQFLFPVHITAAETKDKIPLDIIGTAELEVTNPHKAAFGTDRWDHAMINLITDAITAQVKKMGLDHALTAGNSADARMISAAVEGITEDKVECGIQIVAFRILEINPVLDAEGLKAIQAEAIALQKAKATRIDGGARADALKAVNEANKVGGNAAIATMNAEALVRAAEAAGKNGGSVILMPGSGRNDVDPTQVAILAELKKLNKRT